MQKGKMCAQCGHAVSRALELNNPLIKRWKRIGEMKIALKVDEDALYKALSDAKRNNLPHGKIRDAGHT